MRNHLIYFAIIAVLLVLLILTNCKGETTIVTPEVKGTLHDTIKVTQTRIVPTEKTIIKNIPYEVVKHDTITLDGQTIYIEPIDTLRTESFSKTIEDENLKLTMSGVVTGKINDIKADYTIKPNEIKIPKQSRFGIGISVGVDYKGNPNAVGGLTYDLFKL